MQFPKENLQIHADNQAHLRGVARHLCEERQRHARHACLRRVLHGVEHVEQALVARQGAPELRDQPAQFARLER